ncbi:TfoX/Sxy family protein [Lactiplantibacillus paraplantarum]|uniref:TfoX/Sxy family protein n=1 Tax=Lactiplantibacillus paraplantarum TaxID=60520 RepID=UPI000512C58F|nr:TfoX/Sxy family protein [Lactiplantibacillus paraplantarum]OAX75287.1 TfoX domain protein [Lactiplantibacillus plantarum]ALO05101.1 TfoX domain protein [Lactiplantibacillus paraplantarum]KGE75959.1 TfoX domain protein [Lactiplantibacillus paraplantarum]MCT4456128.1 TfoX domain protein [Lactiplantibacillus paraplantarum]MCW1911314.1 TfoX/Sxy family protein [Lactiplantibacillus paraplantarum]
MDELTTLPNIGPTLAKQLQAVAIRTPEQLKATGSKAAFAAIMKVNPNACIQLLYSLQGAIEHCAYPQLTTTTRKDLQQYFKTFAQ